MTTHSSILAWKMLWTEEPGRLQSVEVQRVGHDLVTKHICTIMHYFKNTRKRYFHFEKEGWEFHPATIPGV